MKTPVQWSLHFRVPGTPPSVFEGGFFQLA